MNSNQNLMHYIRQVVDVAHTFGGCVGGEYVRNFIINKEFNVLTLEIYLFPKNKAGDDLSKILRILQIIGYMVREDTVSNDRFLSNRYLRNLINKNVLELSQYRVSFIDFITKEPYFLNLQFFILKGMDITCLPVDFDIENLVIFDKRLELKSKTLTDSIMTLMKDRIESKRFAYIPQGQFQYGCFSTIVEKAISLMNEGFIMDDSYVPAFSDDTSSKDSWIVSKYKDLACCRKFVSISTSDTTCSLCLEKWKDDDICFNASCLHTFHWRCPLSEEKGLKTWLSTNSTCPMCRNNII